MGLKEFFEKLQNDEDFANKVYDAVIAKRDAGSTEKENLLISVAEDLGYSFTEEEITALTEYQKNQSEELNEEEMGKVAGGTGGLAVATVIMSIGGFATLVSKIIDAVTK